MRYSVVFSSPCECSSRLEEDPWERAEDEFLRRGWPRGTCVSIPNTMFVVTSEGIGWGFSVQEENGTFRFREEGGREEEEQEATRTRANL